MSTFRSQKWDPYLLLGQIIGVQSLFYLGLGFWSFIFTGFLNQSASLNYLFSYDIFEGSTWDHRLFSGMFFLNALNSALTIFYLVGRYKQCLDFAVTIHFYHFVFCWFYNGQMARLFTWYATQFFSIVIMTILSEHLSKKSEMRNIPLASRVDL